MASSGNGIKPFLPARPSGPVFIGLNVLRALSIIALMLVFASNILTMANDIKAIRSQPAEDEGWDCEYYEYSTVPDQTGGPFWSILNRLFIIFESILLWLSEVGKPRRLFETYLPILGPAHGLGCLGAFEALIGAQVLSHYCDLFPQVSAWLLFIIGCFNMIAGLVWCQKAKEKRLIFSWENVSSLTPQTRMAATAWDMVTPHLSEKKRPSAPSSDTSSHQSARRPPAPLQGVPLERSATQDSGSPLLPKGLAPTMAERFNRVSRGFGFGRQGERAAAERGFKISKPLESLPPGYAV